MKSARIPARRATPPLAALLLLAGLLLTLPGCASDARARAQRIVENAGAQEPGTFAAWVRGGGTEGEMSILQAPDAQWAVSARASSSMADLPYMPHATPGSAVAPPDVPEFRVDRRAWGPSRENVGYEWLELKYGIPVHATSVRIRETNACGSVVMVQLRDIDGRYHLIWKGADRPDKYITWLVIDFPPTTYSADTVRVTLDTTLVPHWKMIDAVQLVGEP